MKQYHAHIYYNLKASHCAQELTDRAHSSNLFSLVKNHSRPVGPHPTPMIELHFDQTKSANAIHWLEANRNNFSVLVHQDTGDDLKDHTHEIQWLGEKLTLDFTFFDLILSRPDLRVHT